MILGLGLDIARVDRIEHNIARFGERFLAKICTPSERAQARKIAHPQALANHVAGRVAAKEAACKALGTGFTGGINWHSFEVAREPNGRPTLRATGMAAQKMSQRGVKNVLLSISHDGGIAAAVVVLEGE